MAGYRDKLRAIFAKIDPDASAKLGKLFIVEPNHPVMRALLTEHGNDQAFDIAFHLSDWNEDGAALLAIQLWPEEFTQDEILEVIRDFLIHAPNHIAAAARAEGLSVNDIFKQNDQ